jgi:hypothetical protein
MKYVNFRTNESQKDEGQNRPDLYNRHQSIKVLLMNDQQNREYRLWDFIDGVSAPAEKAAIEKLIAVDPEWQINYRELLEVHQLMNTAELETPSLRFSKNVMEEIAKYQVAKATKSYINKKIIWGIGGFFIIMIFGLLVYVFGQIHWADKNSTNAFSKYNLDKLDWGKFFSNTYINIFMMVNIVLGLVLLDMYLQRRKEQAHHKGV